MDVPLCPWMDGISQGARKAVRLCPWMDGHVHIMAQGARKAVRFTNQRMDEAHEGFYISLYGELFEKNEHLKTHFTVA
jgi:hypothetical protein